MDRRGRVLAGQVDGPLAGQSIGPQLRRCETIFNLYALLDAALVIVLGGGSIALMGPIGLALALPLIIAAQLFLEYRGMGGRLFYLPKILATGLLASVLVANQLGLSPSFGLAVLFLVASRKIKARGEQSRGAPS